MITGITYSSETFIAYGPPNHGVDPAIEMITAPSNLKIHSRWNPVCDNPRFILINKGELPLTDLMINYGMPASPVQSFHWTGNLGFMESEEVELEYSYPGMWEGDDSELLSFAIQLAASSDGVDENPTNNVTLKADISIVRRYTNTLI